MCIHACTRAVAIKVESLARGWLLEKPFWELNSFIMVDAIFLMLSLPQCFLDSSSVPIFIIMLLVWALLSFTTGKPFGTIAQHLQSSFAPDDVTGSIMFVAGELVPL